MFDERNHERKSLTETFFKEIRIAVEKEFPEDPALQQVHIARKIIAKEAESDGLSILEYIRIWGKQVKNGGYRHGV